MQICVYKCREFKRKFGLGCSTLQAAQRKIFCRESEPEELKFILPAVVEEQAKLLVGLSVTDPEEHIKQL